MMYVSVWPSEDLSRRQRSHGTLALSVCKAGPDTRVVSLRESGPSRLRLPRTHGADMEAVMINTGGGIACGDRYDVDITAQEDTALTVTTPGAEKVYRSNGPMAHMKVRLSAAEGADLSWLPQESIIFNEARLTRAFDVELHRNSRFMMGEMVVFGRAAFREEVSEGHFEDRWRIRREGRLIYADTLRLSGSIASLLKRSSVAGGAQALGTVLYAAPDAESRLEEAREVLGAAPSAHVCDRAATALNGMLIARFLSPTIAELRRHVVHFVTTFRKRPMPRVWQT